MAGTEKNSGTQSCPRCGVLETWKDGVTRSGKQRFRCKVCGRCFVLDPHFDKWVIEMADRMLQEALPIPVVAKILDGYVSRTWLYTRRSRICQTKK